MREITIYCSARDQEVRVLVDHDPLIEGEESVLETALYCLEIGRACTGAACLLGAEPAPEVGAASSYLLSAAPRPAMPGRAAGQGGGFP